MAKNVNKRYMNQKIRQREIQLKFQGKNSPVIASAGSPPSKRNYRGKVVVHEGPVDPKGTFGGRCNVTACQRPKSALFLNVGMMRGNTDTSGCYYCVDCASDIHRNNVRNHDDFTLFPAFDAMLGRYRELFKQRKDYRDPENYSDIDQNPWGGTYHFQRDKLLEGVGDDLVTE